MRQIQQIEEEVENHRIREKNWIEKEVEKVSSQKVFPGLLLKFKEFLVFFLVFGENFFMFTKWRIWELKKNERMKNTTSYSDKWSDEQKRIWKVIEDVCVCLTLIFSVFFELVNFPYFFLEEKNIFNKNFSL